MSEEIIKAGFGESPTIQWNEHGTLKERIEFIKNTSLSDGKIRAEMLIPVLDELEAENKEHRTFNLNCKKALDDSNLECPKMPMNLEITSLNNYVTELTGFSKENFIKCKLFEAKIKEFAGDITRASVELAKDWRMDRMLRRLEAMLLVADKKKTLLISGTGDVVEPDQGVLAIGSGGSFAFAAALAYMDNGNLSAREIAERSLRIAAKICIYTNENIIMEELT